MLELIVMPIGLFLPTRSVEDSLYARIRDKADPHAKEFHQTLENMWVDFHPYAPRGFERNLQDSFHQRWWEMYLTLALVRLGLPVTPSRHDHGPDILIEVNGRKIWIEAVAPRPGVTGDAVPEPTLNGCQDLPMRESLLRLTGAVKEKRRKIEGYIQEGIVSERDTNIIAVSSCCLNQFGTLLDFPQPVILRVLAGAGDLVISTNGTNQSCSEFVDTTQRNSGSAVELNLFYQDGYEIVSGILYSPYDPLNAPGRPEEALELFINPNGSPSIPSAITDILPTFSEVSSGLEICWQRTLPSTT